MTSFAAMCTTIPEMTLCMDSALHDGTLATNRNCDCCWSRGTGSVVEAAMLETMMTILHVNHAVVVFVPNAEVTTNCDSNKRANARACRWLSS